jgi:hypothetical protein
MNEKKYNVDEIINSYYIDKTFFVENLINLMLSSDDERTVSKIGFVLVENFKDERIEPCLLSLINDLKWKRKNGTFLYLLSEYTRDKKYLYFLVDLLLKNMDDGEIFMGAYSMIINLQTPLDKEDIEKSLKRLKQDKKNFLDNEIITAIFSLENFLAGQINISNFYSEFE